MKKLILLISLILIHFVGYTQTYPTTYNFTTLGGWSVTNGAGIQAANFLTTNIGATPYPNNATVTMQSPTYNFANCVGTLSITFPIYGIIQNSSDYMYFEIFNGTTWTTLGTHTGFINNIVYTYNISNNITAFRFRLQTDCSVNGYKNATDCSLAGYPATCAPAPGNCNGSLSIYFYDIDYFTINCSNPLPIELISFDGINKGNKNILTWSTASETNNKGFKLLRSSNGLNWNIISFIEGHGTSLNTNKYVFIDNTYEPIINYYRLEQIDFDETSELSTIIDIDNSYNSSKKVTKMTNLMGQEVSDTYNGTVILYSSDGTTKIFFQNN